MKKLITALLVFVLAHPLWAQREQDFATYFMNSTTDTEFRVKNISPAMLQRICESEEYESKPETLAMLRQLKSVRQISCTRQSGKLFDRAVAMADRNAKRYRLYRTSAGSRFYMRKKNNVIVEYIMVSQTPQVFTILDVTGIMTPACLDWLTSLRKDNRKQPTP